MSSQLLYDRSLRIISARRFQRSHHVAHAEHGGCLEQDKKQCADAKLTIMSLADVAASGKAKPSALTPPAPDDWAYIMSDPAYYTLHPTP